MKRSRSRPVILALAVTAAVAAYLLFTADDTAQDQEQRMVLFLDAAIRADPLVAAIDAYSSRTGNPPDTLDVLVPQYLAEVPGTGIPECDRFEYRSLVHKAGSLAWYDLGSRQGQPYTGQRRFDAGEPGHAILVFTLDSQEKITSALIDRMPKGHQPETFEAARWKAGGNRIGMALALSDTYRLHGMPREVFEPLLGPPDGTRVLQGAPWELRIPCPTGLLNHDSFVYWPTEAYPEHLYGGTTESIGSWVYIHSQ